MAITGSIDGFLPPNTIIGWALATPQDAVTVRALRAGECVGEAIAGIFRQDLGAHAGFRLEVSGEIDPIEIATGTVVVTASKTDGLASTLRIWEGLLNRLFALALEHRATRLSNDEWSRFLGVALQYAGVQSRERLERLLASPASPASPSSYIATPDIPSGELSGFSIQPGLCSPSGVATVGRNGHLFVTGGGNSLLEQYRQDPNEEVCRNAGHSWIELFRRRQAALETRRIRYAQMIIPEKSSVLPESYPVRIAPPTPLSAHVRNGAMADPTIAASYCDVLPVVTSHPRRTDLFRRIDSHLSPLGCQEVFAALLTHVGYPLSQALQFTESTVWGGDLVEHFPGLPLRETVHLPERQRVLEIEKALVQTAIHFPGYHNGMYASWTNPVAPTPLRVIAFANSFFGIGDTSSLLTWWAARWFREFHFRWSPSFDYDYIDQIRPDLVIGQTVERFLPVVPVN